MAQPTLADRVLFTPNALFSPWQPSTTVGWAARGILHFVVIMTWLLLVMSWLLPILVVHEQVRDSWEAHRRRNRY